MDGQRGNRQPGKPCRRILHFKFHFVSFPRVRWAFGVRSGGRINSWREHTGRRYRRADRKQPLGRLQLPDGRSDRRLHVLVYEPVFHRRQSGEQPGGWLTRNWPFKFPSCTPPPQGTLQGVITDASNGAFVGGALIGISSGFSTLSLRTGLTPEALRPALTDVTVSRLGYLPATVTGVAISNGTTTTLNVALTGTAAIAAGSTAITAESFSPPNGAIDAGETVTVEFKALNIGAGPTADLVATLLTGGGVRRTQHPQHYGAITPGGSGTRAFTFRADPLLGCGGKLTATLHLQDGSNDLGTISFKFQLAGNLTTVFAESFDSVIAPALPAGWVASNPDASPVLWITSASGTVDTPPNVAFVASPEVASDKRLDSPAFLIRSASAQLTFRHAHTLQPGPGWRSTGNQY